MCTEKKTRVRERGREGLLIMGLCLCVCVCASEKKLGMTLRSDEPNYSTPVFEYLNIKCQKLN